MRLASLIAIISALAVPSHAVAQDILDRLKEEAMGFARGCNYQAYLDAASTISQEWDMISSLQSWKPSGGKDVIPVFDIIGNAFQAASASATEKSAQQQAQGLLYQLEQTCQIAMQVDETNRIHRIYQAGNMNIGNAIDYLVSGSESSITLGTDHDFLGRDFAEVYESMTPDPRYPNDTIYTTINQTMYATLDAADDLLTSLESIEKDIDDLKDQLLLRAELQTDDNGNATGQWICPDGYPGSSGFRNPSDVALETDSNGYPICGPASPARSQQIIASAEILKVQLLSIAQSAEARNLEVQAVGLMADNQKRRQNNHSDKRPLVF